MTSYRSGFQGTETSRAIVTIHSLGDESTLLSGGALRLQGIDRDVGSPVLTDVRTFKALGHPAGFFVVDIKADRASRDLVMELSDDDWVDISFTRFGVEMHTMRGQIEDIRRVQSVVNGATVEVYRVSGRDFGRIFDITPIWFDVITDGFFGPGAAVRIFEAYGAVLADPATVVETILSGFLRELRDIGRANWELPASLPGILVPGSNNERATFIKNIAFDDKDFYNFPTRGNPITPSWFTINNQSIWNLAMQWADLPICEAFADLRQLHGLAVVSQNPIALEKQAINDLGFGLPADIVGPFEPINDLSDLDSNAVGPADSAMAVVFRDRPFLTWTRLDPATDKIQSIEDGPWFQLPLYTVQSEDGVTFEVGRSGGERRNAFFAQPRLIHELAGSYFYLNGPLWNPSDVAAHGLRKMDVVFEYLDANEVLRLSETYRARLRDFHCMNHLFYNGTAEFAHGRPDIRIGTRLRLNARFEQDQETYYVEHVSNRWQLQRGVRTSVGLTRGWIGTDRSYVRAFQEITGKYKATVVASGESLDEAIVDQVQEEAASSESVALIKPTTSQLSKNLLDQGAARYGPFTLAAQALFAQAAQLLSVPITWADPAHAEGSALHTILRKESDGFVGRPNYTYGQRAQSVRDWAEIWDELRDGRITATSSATGLGQLLLRNVESFYPSGRAGIGNPLEEAQGMLAYIQDRYGSPSVAAAQYGTVFEGY